jgi:predicted DNA-binding transcriptional regulator
MPEKLETHDLKLVDILEDFWFTEIKAKIYLYLRKAGKSKAEDIVKGTGLYITSVREALAEMYESGVVRRDKVEKSGTAGKPPYVYEAIQPGELIEKMSSDIQEKLNKIFMLDDILRNPVEMKLPILPIKVRIEKSEKGK